MMLDITGSMSGQKIVDLKLAAKDLVDIVVWADQSEYTSRIALVPFSERVNVGSYAQAVRGRPPQRLQSGLGSFNKQGGGTANWYQIGTCATERTGFDAYTDEPPSTAPVGHNYSRRPPASAIRAQHHHPAVQQQGRLEECDRQLCRRRLAPRATSARPGPGTCCRRSGPTCGRTPTAPRATTG